MFYGINPLCVIVVKASSPWNLVSLKSSFCTHCGFYSVVRRQMTTCDSSGSEKNNHLWGITSTRSLMLHLRPKATPNEKHSRFVGNTEHTGYYCDDVQFFWICFAWQCQPGIETKTAGGKKKCNKGDPKSILSRRKLTFPKAKSSMSAPLWNLQNSISSTQNGSIRKV